MAKQEIIAQKFGGTSVATAERRQRVLGHIKRALDDGFRVAVVVSAMGRRGDPYATDTLLDLLRVEGTPIAGRDYDFIFQAGEIISVAMMTHLLKLNGIPAVGLTGAQAGVQTDGYYRRARIVNIDTSRLRRHIKGGEVPVVTGGQGVSEEGDLNILGRGASDSSGVALGVALGAQKVEIYTDVPGVAVADPRVVPGARFLEVISYDKMYEMGCYGARVMHPGAVLIGQEGGVPIVCRSTFDDSPGTLITETQDEPQLVGIPSLGPVELLVVAGESIDDVTSRELYERLGVLTMRDEASGRLVLAVAPQWRQELEETLSQESIQPVEAFSGRSLISMIGSSQFIERSFPRVESVLAELGVEAFFREKAECRSTFAVSHAESSRLVLALYESFVGQVESL
jgi:aspartate kinase